MIWKMGTWLRRALISERWKACGSYSSKNVTNDTATGVRQTERERERERESRFWKQHAIWVIDLSSTETRRQIPTSDITCHFPSSRDSQRTFSLRIGYRRFTETSNLLIRGMNNFPPRFTADLLPVLCCN